MHDLLTAAEYAAIAETLSFSGNAFIDGAFRPAASGKTFPTVNPATGETLADVAACDSEDVDFAVAGAKEAFEDGRWRQLAPGERKAVLLKLGKLMEENRHELAVLESSTAASRSASARRSMCRTRSTPSVGTPS